MPRLAGDDLSVFTEEFGETVTFNTTPGITAVFEEGKWLGKGGDMGEDADEAFRSGLGNYAVIFLRQDQISARPVYRDKVTRADGSVFTVLEVKPEDGLWKCWATSDERMSF